MMTQHNPLDRLIAKDQIRDLCYRYARGADRLDGGSYESAFWHDGAFNQLHSGRPFSEVAEELVGVMGKFFSLTHHLNGNILIDFIDPDHATAEVYFQAFHVTNPELKPDEIGFLVGERRLAELSHVLGNVYEIVVGGRYLDDLERRDGSWKIRTRRLIFDYCTVKSGSVVPHGEGMMAFGAAAMTRDQSDPSYRQARPTRTESPPRHGGSDAGRRP